MNESGGGQLSRVAEHLEQGDLFALDLVTPLATRAQRIFRTKDGRHGHLVFEGVEEGRLFERVELEQLLADMDAGNRTAEHTPPFGVAPNGDPELVIAPAYLRGYFVVATQTCDISGLDKPPLDAAIVLPVQTVQDMCLTTLLEFTSEGGKLTIHEFLVRNIPGVELHSMLGPAEYGRAIRQALAGWIPADKKILQDRNRVANLLKQMLKSKIGVYYLSGSETFDLPESIIDFTAAYTMQREVLLRNRTARVARIASPMREDFAHRFAHFISRVALPADRGPADFA